MSEAREYRTVKWTNIPMDGYPTASYYAFWTHDHGPLWRRIWRGKWRRFEEGVTLFPVPAGEFYRVPGQVGSRP